MTRKLTLKERLTYNSYHIPGCSLLYKPKVNAIYLRKANDRKHELAKCSVCLDLLYADELFVTEAARNKREGGRTKVVDVVNLSTGEECEVVFRHEGKKEIAEYKAKGVKVVEVK